MEIKTKRIYDDPEAGDGFRVLVDRLWPRGMTKEAAAIDLWCKEVAPSSTLRKEFAHMPERFDAFRRAYTEELRANAAAMDDLLKTAQASRRKSLTLLYGARDPACNHAIVLGEALRGRC